MSLNHFYKNGPIGTRRIDDEDLTIQDAIHFASRSGILQRHHTSASALKGGIFSFSSWKRGWSEEERESYRDTSPRDWWSKYRADFPVLGEFAGLVFAVPTSSAASERAWSIFDIIHSKRRNRLLEEKVDKLVYVYINHAALDDEPVDAARIQLYEQSTGQDIESEPEPSAVAASASSVPVPYQYLSVCG